MGKEMTGSFRKDVHFDMKLESISQLSRNIKNCLTILETQAVHNLEITADVQSSLCAIAGGIEGCLECIERHSESYCAHMKHIAAHVNQIRSLYCDIDTLSAFAEKTKVSLNNLQQEIDADWDTIEKENHQYNVSGL
ncbi:hypothetical protein QR680_000029 [Steinernema hermaphroditum]|uniref:Uncharacterized protein n=1 Tax=Steinernema hermaphroditum TaxID=289476 RepID=A0AA39GVT7_9BILA|nr:hypothetical protein QR680_000029 [Steinernema hermaphroditum]